MTLLAELRDVLRGAREFYLWLDSELTAWMLDEGVWMADDNPICPVGGPPHPARDRRGQTTGHRLCEKHLDELGKMLREIETEYDDVVGSPDDPDSPGVLPSIAISYNTGGGGSSGGGAPAFEQAPARLDPLVLTDRRRGRGDSEYAHEERQAGRTLSVLAVLAEYATRVRTERELAVPVVEWADRIPGATFTGPLQADPLCPKPCAHDSCRALAWWRMAPAAPTVHSERLLLSRHLEWVAGWRPAPDFDYGVEDVYRRLRVLRGQLRAVNGTAQHPVGSCPVDKPDGARCAGPLWPAKPTHSSGEWAGSSPSAVRCENCGTQWEGPGELARLALMLEAQREAQRKERTA